MINICIALKRVTSLFNNQIQFILNPSYGRTGNASAIFNLLSDAFICKKINPLSAKKNNASENVFCWSCLLQIIA